MGLTLPYPTQPAVNSALASVPVLANVTAIAQAIQAFDGSQINAGSVSATALSTNINPNTLLHDTIAPFVEANCIWSAVSGLVGTMTGGIIYVGPSGSVQRVVVNGIGSKTFTASSDTYIDIDYNGNVTYSAVSNNASAPTITANAVRVAKVITNGTAITSVIQTGYDSLNNLIYPTSPSQNAGKLDVGSYTNAGTAGGTFSYMNLGGIKFLWGITAALATGTSYGITFPPTFFATIQTATLTAGVAAGTASAYGSIASQSTTTMAFNFVASAGSGTMPMQVFVIGV